MARAAKSSERKQRLAAALRENLKRRKARERALADGEAESGGPVGRAEAGCHPQKTAKPE